VTKEEVAMKKKVMCWAEILLVVLVSCAVITVNVYFPEKDVKEAYKTLEKELATPGNPEPEQEQEPKTKPDVKDQSSIRFEVVPSANALEAGLADKIAQIIRNMPDVVNAYREIGARLPQIDKLRESGVVGEGNNGMLVVRDEKLLTPDSRNLINMHNENRKTIMNGMARAIIRINRVPENEQNLRQVLPQAVEQFAAVRRDLAKKGWWIQDQYGNWTRK
jgi:hypothetical protein